MASTEAGGSQLFVRQSTGLVREASALDATIYNAVFSAPVGATLAWGVFFALSAFPGADLVWATIISFVLNIPVLIMMALLASSMPRTTCGSAASSRRRSRRSRISARPCRP